MADPTPVPVTPKAPTINWATLLASIIAAFFVSPQVLPNVLPSPTPKPIIKPDVTPKPSDVVVDPPAPPLPPKPKPVDPSPKPDPTPIVPAPPITTGVSITDSKGKALGNAVEAGQMFVVSAAPGITLTPVPSGVVDADIVELADNKLVCSLKNGCTLQIVVSGSGAKPTIVQVQCNHAPQPPPVVVPPKGDPTPIVVPVPQPVVSGPLSIGIIEDSKNRSPAMATILSNEKLWDKYRAAGHRIRIWHAGANPSTETEAVSDAAALKVQNILLPGIVVRNQAGAVVVAAKMPLTQAEVDSVLGPITGVK